MRIAAAAAATAVALLLLLLSTTTSTSTSMTALAASAWKQQQPQPQPPRQPFSNPPPPPPQRWTPPPSSPNPPPTPPHASPPPPPPPATYPPPPPPPSPPPPPPPSNCSSTEITELTQGPYWVEEDLERSDVTGNLTYGVPLTLVFRVVEESSTDDDDDGCEAISDVRVDLWQCRYDGAYSDESEESTSGETWLRGYQLTNSSGYATFYTIYPGWYVSRTVHIHLRLRIYESDGNTTSYEDTTQLYFDDDISNAIFENVYPYNSRGYLERDTFNNNDTLFYSNNMLTLVGSYNDTNGYSSTMEFKLPFSSISESNILQGNIPLRVIES